MTCISQWSSGKDYQGGVHYYGTIQGVSTDLEQILRPITLTNSSDHRDRLRKLLKEEGFQELVLEENETYRERDFDEDCRLSESRIELGNKHFFYINYI